ncbi:hypothetical protein TBLA_0A09600 [Henningerozyma blattae CBS 6284]|uniref:FAD-binding FR-type domain-containing protein n=1 Tax=Henningerozyma blattae (strain ATCC 34711 / CBS 6284 / DSM 70876 / NBRC 10599 / NRRL Y-10934 / UCD 77-7) TaxID=1071380 RepID=I2GX92_HENB6|nr:hypothetical protein TBLA_0A09600 [Tetrapisispora blattae CBS 6284]CCH58744.1 hypothetical protein TBLA_0A09600 [Tetrapisispora blattae CBS 6284]
MLIKSGIASNILKSQAASKLVYRYGPFRSLRSDTLLNRKNTLNKKLFVFGGISLTIGALYNFYSAYESKRVLETPDLNPITFSKYAITYKESIDDTHFLLELTPIGLNSRDIWKEIRNSKIWSVEVKQPDIMVVRNYTPLPLYFNKKDQRLHQVPSVKHVEENKEFDTYNNSLMFYIKKYENGEVTRWLCEKPIDAIVEIRGPIIDLNVNEIVSDYSSKTGLIPSIQFITAGTGIVSALQLAFQDYKGFKINLVDVCNDIHELGPLKELTLQRSLNSSIFTLKNIETKNDLKLIHVPSTLAKLLDIPYQPQSRSNISTAVFSAVCGPEGFVSLVAGPKLGNTQGQIAGLLANIGWTSRNVYKMY